MYFRTTFIQFDSYQFTLYLHTEDANNGENTDIIGNSENGSTNRLEGSVPSPLDISQADPIYLFNEYMRVVETDLTSIPSNVGQNKTAKENKNDTAVVSDASSESGNIDNKEQKLFLHNNVIIEGLRTLDRILNENSITGSTNMVGESRVKKNNFFDLNLHAVSLVNFGPYGGDRVNYPLQKR